MVDVRLSLALGRVAVNLARPLAKKNQPSADTTASGPTGILADDRWNAWHRQSRSPPPARPRRAPDRLGRTSSDTPSLLSVTTCGNVYERGQIPAGRLRVHVDGRPSPRHVHVYRDAKLVVKWDVENKKAMKGAATPRILALIAELETEGLL